MNIRPYNAEDATAMAILFQRSVRGVGRLHYSARQVDAWAARGPDAARIRAQCADGRIIRIAENDAGEIIGFCDLEPIGHIDFLYCAPESNRLGVGAALYQAIEMAARNWNLTRLHVEASEAARLFFWNMGFSLTQRRDFEIAGVPIHNFAMAKVLTPLRVG
jgi:putative acetyltransferase